MSREKKSAGRIVTAIVRILLGLVFLVFGLNGFLNFMPQPKDLPQDRWKNSKHLFGTGSPWDSRTAQNVVEEENAH